MADKGAQNGFGWAPVGARLLREFSQTAAPVDSGPTVRYAKTWTEIKALPIMEQLLTLSTQQMVLLHAVDTLPRGGLCQGPALKESLRRYEKLWLPLVAQHHATAVSGDGFSHLVPPVDIALLWHLHRLQPRAYAADCREIRTQSGAHSAELHVQPEQAFAFSDGRDAAGAAAAAAWRVVYPSEPFWPPAAPGSQTASFRSHLSADLAAVAVRVPVFTHQLLRAAYVSRPFLTRAVDRYAKFLLLQKHHLELQHPIPPLDVALIWASHMSVSGQYAADCQQLLQHMFLDMSGASASLWLERDTTGPWRFHWTDTQRAWLDEFDEPFVVPAAGYVPLSSPHPTESMFRESLLAAFEDGSSTKQQAWRAGAHSLYLAWLENPNLKLQQQYKEQLATYGQEKDAFDAHMAASPQLPLQPSTPPPPQKQQQKSSGLFACFGCGGADADLNFADPHHHHHHHQQPPPRSAGPVPPQQPVQVPRLSEEALTKLAAGFSGYQNLPLSSSHAYWRQLIPRGSDASIGAPAEPGAEVEVFTAQHKANSSKGPHPADVYKSDQGVVTGAYEVEAAGGQALMW